MITELDFLNYIEKQLVSAGEMVYTEWLKSEIRMRKATLEIRKDILKEIKSNRLSQEDDGSYV